MEEYNVKVTRVERVKEARTKSKKLTEVACSSNLVFCVNLPHSCSKNFQNHSQLILLEYFMDVIMPTITDADLK